MDLLHRKAQSYKFSNKNGLFCPWWDFNKTFCGTSTYHKWMFKLRFSSIFNFDRAHQSWISGVLGVKARNLWFLFSLAFDLLLSSLYQKVIKWKFLLFKMMKFSLKRSHFYSICTHFWLGKVLMWTWEREVKSQRNRNHKFRAYVPTYITNWKNVQCSLPLEKILYLSWQVLNIFSIEEGTTRGRHLSCLVLSRNLSNFVSVGKNFTTYNLQLLVTLNCIWKKWSFQSLRLNKWISVLQGVSEWSDKSKWSLTNRNMQVIWF